MRNLGGKVVADGTAPASHPGTGTKPVFRRVLLAIKDESQIEHAVELARRAGASEARVLHLSLYESIRGRRYALETESSAVGLAEAAILELRLAGISATGQVLDTLVDRAAQAITADATQWAADLIVLGVPRRSRLATRLFGSVTTRVQRHAPCPVLVASAPLTGADLGTGHRAHGRSDDLSAAPAR
jgi:nucleotide-binding universal stress UspA family protein